MLHLEVPGTVPLASPGNVRLAQGGWVALGLGTAGRSSAGFGGRAERSWVGDFVLGRWRGGGPEVVSASAVVGDGRQILG
jgi:hypothetical protein